MSDIQDTKRFNLWTMLTVIFAVSCAVAAGTWYLARAHISDELAQYEKSKYWNLPENLKALGSLSNSVALQLKEREELENLRKGLVDLKKEKAALTNELNKSLQRVKEDKQKIEELTTHVSELEIFRQEIDKLRSQLKNTQQKLNISNSSINSLKNRIKELEGETFTVQVGSSHSIVPGLLAVGVKESSDILSEADIQFGDKTYVNIIPGTPMNTTIEGTEYTVILLSTGRNSCKFSKSSKSKKIPLHKTR